MSQAETDVGTDDNAIIDQQFRNAEDVIDLIEDVFWNQAEDLVGQLRSESVGAGVGELKCAHLIVQWFVSSWDNYQVTAIAGFQEVLDQDYRGAEVLHEQCTSYSSWLKETYGKELGEAAEELMNAFGQHEGSDEAAKKLEQLKDIDEPSLDALEEEQEVRADSFDYVQEEEDDKPEHLVKLCETLVEQKSNMDSWRDNLHDLAAELSDEVMKRLDSDHPVVADREKAVDRWRESIQPSAEYFNKQGTPEMPQDNGSDDEDWESQRQADEAREEEIRQYQEVMRAREKRACEEQARQYELEHPNAFSFDRGGY